MLRPHWNALRVAHGDARTKPLEGAARTAALYRWYAGDVSIAVHGPHGPHTDARAIDWTGFPTHEVLAGLTAERTPAPPADELPVEVVRVEDEPAEGAPPVRRRSVLRSRSTLDRAG